MPEHGKLIRKQELLSLIRGIMIVRIREVDTTLIGEPQIIHFDYESATDKLKLLLELDFAVPAGKTVGIVEVASYDESGGAPKTVLSVAENKETNVNTIYTLEDLFIRLP